MCAAADSSAPTDIVCMDADGDLTLVVGNDEPVRYRVCSATLSRSSRVFRAMLHGRFKEARPSDPSAPWVVTVPEDDPAVAEIWLNIIHGRFEHVPATWDLEEPEESLYAILVFADKYDVTRLFQPWVQGWVSSMVPLLGDGPYIFPAIAVARELGCREMVEKLATKMITDLDTDSDGNLLLPTAGAHVYITIHEFKPSWSLVPLDLVEKAARIRAKIILDVAHAIQTTVRELNVAVAEKETYLCRARRRTSHSQKTVCQTFSLGAITAALYASRTGELLAIENCLKPGPEEASAMRYMTVDSLREALGSKDLIRPKPFHDECNLLDDLITKVLNIIDTSLADFVLTEEALQYMAKRRAQLGEITIPEVPGWG